jgi:hypothetical protein
MATNFKNKVSPNIGVTPVDVITVSPAAKLTIIGLSLTNLTEGVVVVSVKVTDADSVTGHYIKNVPIPAHQTLRVVNGGEKLIMAGNNILTIVSLQEDAVDAIVSYVEII